MIIKLELHSKPKCERFLKKKNFERNSDSDIRILTPFSFKKRNKGKRNEENKRQSVMEMKMRK